MLMTLPKGPLLAKGGAHGFVLGQRPELCQPVPPGQPGHTKGALLWLTQPLPVLLKRLIES